MLDGVHFGQCHLVRGDGADALCPMAVAAARMGSIVLRLCRTSTPPANPPVGGCMPVNYCTLGEKKREEGRGRRR